MHREAAYTYFDMITDQEANFFLRMGGKRVLVKALSQSLIIGAVKMADRPPSRLCAVRTGCP
jgi:hypothetical protein